MPKLKTALITGSSEGIGRSFAEVYAKNGHDLVLVARNAAKLMDFASELKAKYAVCLLYTSPSPRDLSTSRMPSSA